MQIPVTAPEDLIEACPKGNRAAFRRLFEAYRSIVLDGQAPAPWMLLYPLAFASLMLLVFVPLYASEQSQFAKVV